MKDENEGRRRTDLDAAVEGNHDVVGFDITMDDFLFVKMLEASKSFTHDEGDLRFRHLLSSGDDLSEILSVDQFHRNLFVVGGHDHEMDKRSENHFIMQQRE